MRNDSVTRIFTQPNYFRIRVESPLKLICWALVLSLCIGTAAAEERYKNPLAPPDTSSPRATLQSLLDNVREAYDVLMPAYASYLAEPSLFPPDSAREVEERTKELLERAVRTLNLGEIARALRANVGLERALLLKECSTASRFRPSTLSRMQR